MARALEVLFSRWLQLAALLVVPLSIAMGIVLTQPRLYQGSATLWALRRYEIVGATGPESDLTSSPASTQATALTELLQTRQFALAIGYETHVDSTYSAAARANAEARDAAIYADISQHVIVTPTGYNLMSVTYTNPSPHMAQSVVQAVLDQYGSAAGRFSVEEAKQLLLVYQQQLQQAQDASSKAAAVAASYLAAHPGATPQHDPEYNILFNAAENAQANVNAVQTNISQINQEVAAVDSTSNSLYTVVDDPTVGQRPVSRTKTLLMGGGIGLAIGIFACALLLIIAMRRDRSIYSAADLQRIIEAPVLLQIPQMHAQVLAQAVNRADASKYLAQNR